MKRWRLLVAGAGLLASVAAASGYALLGSTWNTSPVVMHVNMGASGPLIDGAASWNAVASGALSTWNSFILRLQFSPVVDSPRQGDRDGVNNVFFSSTIYGDDFDDAVAVTTEWNLPGNSRVRTEADVIFNAALNWNSYRGPLRDAANGETIYDLRRVALHEFGHVVGLDHPDEAGQSVRAIMNSRVSNTDELQADDLRGGQYLYGYQPGTLVAGAAGPAVSVASFDRPKQKNLTTTNTRFLFVGSADRSVVRTVFLVNSRSGPARFFKARGVAKWNLTLTLKPGRNVVTLYVRRLDGVRKKIDRRVITISTSD